MKPYVPASKMKKTEAKRKGFSGPRWCVPREEKKLEKTNNVLKRSIWKDWTLSAVAAGGISQRDACNHDED
jgi:hypothetical protein